MSSRTFIRTFIILLAMMSVAESRAAERLYLSGAEWSKPRSGSMVIALPAVNHAVRELIGRPTAVLTLYYPGGDVGAYWAEELRGWLIALGISSDRIDMVPGSGEADMIAIEVVERGSSPAR